MNQAVFLKTKTLIILDVHPNVIIYFRIDIIDNLPRIFKEYANNGYLRDLINSQNLKKDTIDLIIQICSGMPHAHNHNKGSIYRD